MSGRPDWVTRLNYLGAAVGGARYMVDLEPQGLLEAARRATGLQDFPEQTWRQIEAGLALAVSPQADMHLLGRLIVRNELLRALRNQLLVHAALLRQPALTDQPIRAPIVITGHPRTGTTLLHELMALDPQLRAPLAWEVSSPVPAPPHSIDDDISLAEIAQCENEFWLDAQPDIRAQHELRWDAPAECHHILGGSFARIWSFAGDYAAWQNHAQPAVAYAWHKKIVQILQYARPAARWLLKCPVHAHFLDDLLNVYPDATIILTHRDPVKTLPSAVSLRGHLQGLRFKRVDSERLAQNIAMMFEGCMRKVLQERSDGTIPARQIIDVQFKALMDDPVATLSRIYDHLQLPLSAELAENIKAYLRAKPRYRFGQLSYDGVAAGLQPDQIRRRFAFYTDHYAIAADC